MSKCKICNTEELINGYLICDKCIEKLQQREDDIKEFIDKVCGICGLGCEYKEVEICYDNYD